MFNWILQLFDMGGYGVYIWPCYALLLSIIAWLIFSSLRRNIAMRTNLKQNLWSEGSDRQP